jgi:uncharacterized protein (TIGR03000 family)
MICQSFTGRNLAAVIVVCCFALEPAPAQLAGGPAPGTRLPDGHHPYDYPAATYPGGPGLGWGYYGLYGGPWVGWPWFYSGANRGFWTNGLSLYGPPVPTYGPTPGVFGQGDLNRTWNNYLNPMQPGFGWIGIYSPSPRPFPPTVGVWARPLTEPVAVLPADTVKSAPGGCLILSVKLPQPAAEVLVDGMPTRQTGTDRVFESPPLDGGKEYRYELTARWMEGGAMVERKKVASGKPGDVVRLDFTLADEVPVVIK